MRLAMINKLVRHINKRFAVIVNQIEFLAAFRHFQRLSSRERFVLKWKDRHPCLKDKTATTDFDRHYIYHTAWAARILAVFQPKIHVDISSSLYFSSIASAFIPMKFYDFRPVQLGLDSLESHPANLLDLEFEDNSVSSLSCMHVVEHIGLGRYGDALDPDGDLKAIKELKRVLAVGGQLLFVVPIGRPKIAFNAHRIYSYRQVMECFSDITLLEFALIPDSPDTGGLVRNATEAMADAQAYGCGCFLFKKSGIIECQ